MKLFGQLLFFLVYTSIAFGQEGFRFTSNKTKVSIPFKFANNLIVLPIKVNGVEETILFSLDNKEEIELFEVQKVKLKGLGEMKPTEGLKASKNVLMLPGLECKNHDILVILDQEFNFSSSLGIPVNGIIGYHFFRNNMIEIDYSKQKIYVYNRQKFKKDKLKKYTPLEIVVENAKPYIQTLVTINDNPIHAKCLVDTGNSDPVWMFKNQSSAINIPDKNFDDFLGRGFNGEIHGKRARIEELTIEDFKFKKLISSFPDSVSISNVKMVKNRLGSLGGEILRRFNVVFDYQENKMYLKKNKHFNAPFNYNISGVNVHHAGLQWVSQQKTLLTELRVTSSDKSHYTEQSGHELKYNFMLKPLYEISNVRRNSVAERVGLLKGDVIETINNKSVYRMSLSDINAFLKADAGQYISIRVKRNHKELFFHFLLEELL